MKLPVYLARVWGLGIVLIFAGLLINRKSFIGTIEHLQAGNISMLLAGVLALGIGAAQVAGFNSWTLDYRGLVTLFGWLSLLKGSAILFAPDYLARFAQVFVKETWYRTLLGLSFLAGAYLCYVGFARSRANVSLPAQRS